ncbi:hypothetical protein [Shewanella sp. ENK2]|uniref:hypothetical protein n=1 Tax=Shewanella sp. ENK2 TaxID=2775245 RepID=UPI003747AED7
MLVVTNYPQVPIATSNVATDLARADNQQAKPILPPQELSKAYQERAYNQQNERLTRHELLDQKQQQKQSAEQQQTQQQTLGPKGIFPQLLRVAANSNPTIQRRDIQQKNPNNPNVETDKISDNNNSRAIQSLLLHDANQEQEQAFYEQLGERVGQFYQQQTTPAEQSQLFALV